MLTISELARFAGVTVRAVRHYHARGLLPEPARDASGYRRYDAQAVVDLIRIKTLAEAGVPLARVSELLRAEPDQFARAVQEIDRRLRSEIRRKQQHRTQVAQLASGDGLALPAEVVDYLGRLRAIGLSERIVAMERDGWILLAAHAPDRVPGWIEQKREALDDGTYRDLYRTFDQAYEWPPDDPRLAELADVMGGYVAELESAAAPSTEDRAQADLDEPVVSLIDAQTIEASSTWQRLGALLEERGWSGWTRVARVDVDDS